MAITAAQVKELREATGVGMMECKKALTETNGDMDKAMEWLRKKGIASAEKKAGRVAAEGVVEAYIHMGGKIGVMVEVNCETDFVAKTPEFHAFVRDIAMHIAAANPTYLNREEVPAEILDKEREILRAQALNEGKPEKIVDRMVEGRVEKFYKENCLVDQPFVKDPDKTIAQYVTERVQMTGENIKIRRFVRYEMGEGLEKRHDNFAEEVAAQTKKAGKIAAEGVSYAITADNGVGVVIEVNSQTDFVAKNEVFQGFVKDLATIVANENPADVEALKACTYPGTDRTVADVTADKVLAIGENIQVRRFVRYAEGVNVPYIHMGGKIGVLVNLEVEGIEADKVTELGKDIAMQIAAMNPAYLDKSDVDQTTLDKEKEILLIQAKEDPKNANKPENIIEKMVMGRIGKYYEENCLLQQAFVKENKVSVEKHIAEVAKQLGGKIAVKAFTRFQTGEGIEKAEEDFAAEVASMIH